MSSRQYYNKVIPASDLMFRYALSIVKEEDAAKDVLQECLLNIWKKRDSLKAIQNHNAWLMKIIRNKSLDWIKGRHFSKMASLVEEPSYHTLADDEVNLHDQQKWLKEVLDSLSQKQREVFQLREIEEMTYDEIGEVMGIDLNEVKVNLHRARIKVRSMMLKLENYGVAN